MTLIVAADVQVADPDDGRLYGPGETITTNADTDTLTRFAPAIRAGWVEVHTS